jgi:hypothetical protein
MARSSRQLTGNQNILRAKSSESALNSGIPVYSIFTHTSDFVQTQNEAKILTNSPFSHSGTKSLDRFGNTFPVQTKITPPFCQKGIKGKTE